MHHDLFTMTSPEVPKDYPSTHVVSTSMSKHHMQPRKSSYAQQANVETLEGRDPIQTILDYARSHGITQIFVGHSQRKGFWQQLLSNPVERLIAESEGIDVRVFPHRAGRAE